MIDRVRVFASYREYPKYRMISRWIYKQALLQADRLVAAGVVDAPTTCTSSPSTSSPGGRTARPTGT